MIPDNEMHRRGENGAFFLEIGYTITLFAFEWDAHKELSKAACVLYVGTALSLIDLEYMVTADLPTTHETDFLVVW